MWLIYRLPRQAFPNRFALGINFSTWRNKKIRRCGFLLSRQDIYDFPKKLDLTLPPNKSPNKNKTR